MNGTDALKTYYVYDDFGLLRFVLTPEAVSKGATSYINEYCYTYKYDHRHRLIEKKLPGADPIFYKYDNKDRLVLSQDGNQRLRSVWSYTLYDNKNRSIEIGETTSTPPTTIGDSYDPSNKSALQYLYYDNYNYAGVQSFNTTENISGVDKYLHVTGLQTGAKTKVLGTDSWIITTTYFDNKVHPIQVIADIYGVTGGKSIVSTKYDFVGNVLQTREKHENDVVVSTNTYDTRGRLLTTSTSLNSSTPATMTYVYDELGRLATKKYGNNTVSETYAYNVRGWLTEKNSSKFNMKLRYQNPTISGTTARYNGNITEWEWKQGANATQTYTFTYDGISRLTDNKQYGQNGSSWVLNNSYVEQGLTYDLNGNIKSLKRYRNASVLDNLGYSYSGNQLTTLTETGGTTAFTYDQNGNMTKDSRKNLDYQYNSLNLLSEVKQGSTSKAKYVYAADGTKLAVVGNGNGNGYDYRGSLIYKRSGSALTLESAAFSDGRITKTNSTYVPSYFITDHLGSVRVIFNASGTVLEQNDYYAFGGRHLNSSSTTSDNRFRYNGKELQTTGDVGFLDYGARMYDSKLGRWFGQDPLAEKYYSLSCYNYCVNNPILFIDPNGEDVWTTSNFNEISSFLSNLSAGKDYSSFLNWTHFTDDEFLNYDQGFNSYLRLSDNGNYYYTWKELKGEDIFVNSIKLPQLNTDLYSHIQRVVNYGGISASIVQEAAFSKTLNTWMGKDFKIRSQNWGGNQYTGGKFSYAAKVAKYAKWAGWGATAASAFYTEYQHDIGNIGNFQRATDHTITGLSQIPLYGIGIGIGYELGKEYGPSKWFKTKKNRNKTRVENLIK